MTTQIHPIFTVKRLPHWKMPVAYNPCRCSRKDSSRYIEYKADIHSLVAEFILITRLLSVKRVDKIRINPAISADVTGLEQLSLHAERIFQFE